MFLSRSKDIIELEARYREKKDEYEELKEEFAKCKPSRPIIEIQLIIEYYQIVENNYKRQKVELKRNLQDLTRKYPLTDEAKEAFESFPNDLEELREMLIKERSIVEMRDCLDASVVEQLDETVTKARDGRI